MPFIDDDADVRELARANRTHEAVQLYRQRHGVSVHDATFAVNAMAFPERAPPPPPPPPAPASAHSPLFAAPAPAHATAMPRGATVSLPDGGSMDAEVMEHLRNGHLINAIKRYRELFGTGLAESKNACEALRDGRPYSHPSLTHHESSATPPAPHVAAAPSSRPDDLLEQIDALLREGRVIEAIKLHRQHTGAGLSESKNAIDARRAELRV